VSGGNLPPLALYIHVPYCVRKCPYCDFHSTVEQTVPEPAYLLAIQRELTFWRQYLNDDSRPIHSIFFGGGTPSLLQGETIGQILKQVKNLWPLQPQCEISLEANPESCHPDKIAQWLSHGINRLSLGIQSFNQERLTSLERPHNLTEARQAIQLSRQGGVTNINLDLIFATADQTTKQWQDELAEAMAWQPQHLSCYGLSIEEGTAFARRQQQGKLATLPEEKELALFSLTRQTLAKGGWQEYEISNFCQPNYACQHNLNYWRSGDYIGVGPAAHGRLSQIITEKNSPASLKICRTSNQAGAYLEKQATDGSALHTEKICSNEEAGIECLLMGLRLKEGVSREMYKKIRGYDVVERHHQEIKTCQEAGLLIVEPKRVLLTKKGTPLLDAILARLL
jgi:oxygen-independent coproporphyrinogen III oxidase